MDPDQYPWFRIHVNKGKANTVLLRQVRLMSSNMYRFVLKVGVSDPDPDKVFLNLFFIKPLSDLRVKANRKTENDKQL